VLKSIVPAIGHYTLLTHPAFKRKDFPITGFHSFHMKPQFIFLEVKPTDGI